MASAIGAFVRTVVALVARAVSPPASRISAPLSSTSPSAAAAGTCTVNSR